MGDGGHGRDLDPPEPIEGVFTPLSKAVIVPPTWLINDLLPTGLTIVGAPPKSMKSTFQMAIACLIAGYKCNALPPGMDAAAVTGRVVGFSYEATAGELRHMAETGLGVKLEDDESILICDEPWLFQLDDEGGVQKLLFWLNELKPKLAFLDPFAEFHSIDEKDAASMIRLLRPLHRWAKDNDASFVVVHHTRKKMGGDASSNTATDLRGSSAIYGKADGILVFTPKDEKGLISIAATFKRGASWVREVQFNVYEKGKHVRAHEVIGDVERLVLGIMKGGDNDTGSIAAQVHCSRKRVREAIETLIRTGRLAKTGRGTVVVPKKSVRIHSPITHKVH